jgi:hypothetical protein
MLLSEARGMLHALSFVEEKTEMYDALTRCLELVDTYIQEVLKND